MGVFKIRKFCILFVLLTYISSFHLAAQALLAATNQQMLAVLPDGNAQVLASVPFGTPILNTNVLPFGKLISNQGQQAQLGYQQQQELNYQPGGPNQPLSGLIQPFSSPKQPLSSSDALNQPFGASNQQGLVANLPFAGGVSEEKTSVLRVVLFSLIALMVPL